MIQEPGISILIRTSNSETSLRALLNQLQISARDEIILVDSGSKDGTVALAERAGARVILNEGPFNYSRTLNLGFRAARNEWVLSLSSHCLPARRDYLEIYRKTLAQFPEKVAVIYGMYFFSRYQYIRCDKSPKVRTGTEALKGTEGGGNANALYSKRVWEMHPFDESLQTGEDLAWQSWSARSGFASVWAPEAGVFYRHLGGPIYRFRKARNEVWIFRVECYPQSFRALAIGLAHASRHLLWEEFLPRCWMGQVAHLLGTFVASRTIQRKK